MFRVYLAPSCHTIPQSDPCPISSDPLCVNKDDHHSEEDIRCIPAYNSVIQDQDDSDSPTEAAHLTALDMQHPSPVPQDHPPPGQRPHRQWR